MKSHFIFQVGVMGLGLGLTACGTSQAPKSTIAGTATTTTATSGDVETALPLVRTGAAVAAGGVLNFAVKTSGTRTRLANEMYAAANAVYSLTGGTFPTPAQFQANIEAFGGSQADASYGQFSTAIAALYAAYYPKLATGDVKTGADLLNAIAAGIEDATQAYVTTPVVAENVVKGSF
jgi:hypothetical protein